MAAKKSMAGRRAFTKTGGSTESSGRGVAQAIMLGRTLLLKGILRLKKHYLSFLAGYLSKILLVEAISKMTMTDEQIKQYHATVDDNIEKFGYHSTFVFADSTPSFCYSTGIYKSFGIPEIFISALPQNLSHELIKNYADNFKDQKVVPVNERIDYLTDRFSVYLIEVANDKLVDYVLSSVRFYKGEDYRYLQMVYPDVEGYFPDEAGYDYDQVILGPFKS